jgi:hypothetical protein
METLKETALNSCNTPGILQFETCEIAVSTIPRIFIVYVKYTWVRSGVFVATLAGVQSLLGAAFATASSSSAPETWFWDSLELLFILSTSLYDQG